jgi:hypothetical protein
MLGSILGGLTDAAVAESVLAAIGDDAMLERVRKHALESGVSPGVFAAATVRHLLDHGSEEVWLDLLGKMAGSPQPGVAALRSILASSFGPALPSGQRREMHP